MPCPGPPPLTRNRHSAPILLALLSAAVGCSKGSEASKVIVIESRSATLGPEGGEVALADGSTVVLPPGALASSSKVTVKSVDPTSYFDGAGESRKVISVEGLTSALLVAAELRVPLPAGFVEATAPLVTGGILDEATGAIQAETVHVRSIEGKPFAVIEASHFSSRVIEWIFGASPPAAFGPLDIPYYGQGSSNYCWAASMNMITQAARHNHQREVHEIVGRVGVDEGGVTDWAFRFNDAIAALVASRTGVRPTRYQWDYINANQALDYIRREIGLSQRPVAVYVGAWEHAVVVVGYDGSTVYVHNPNSTAVGAIGFTARPWAEFTGNMAVRDKLVTVVVPKALDPSRPSATVNIMSGAFELVKPKVDPADQSRLFRFTWDYREREGYAFRETMTDVAADVLPGTVAVLSQGGDIEVVNASRTMPKTLTVWLDIFGKGPETTHYSTSKQVMLPANSSGRVKFDDIPVDEFRDNDIKPVEYRLQTAVFENSVMVDSADIAFTVEPVTPELTALAPTTAGIGGVVTLTGKGFGTVRGQGVVTFSGLAAAATEYVSWSDTEIKVKVPTGAKTGPVVVMRGKVPSKSQTLTIIEQSTLTGTWTFDGPLVLAVATWTLTGKVVAEELSPTQSTYPRLTLDNNTPFEVSISVAWTQKKTTVRVDREDGGYVLMTYKTPKRLDDAETLFLKGAFPHSANFTNSTFAGSGTFTGKDQWFGPQFSYAFPYDWQSFDKSGTLLTEELDKQDPWMNGEVFRIVLTSGN